MSGWVVGGENWDRFVELEYLDLLFRKNFKYKNPLAANSTMTRYFCLNSKYFRKFFD